MLVRPNEDQTTLLPSNCMTYLSWKLAESLTALHRRYVHRKTYTEYIVDTVESRYPELGYIELCETRSVYMNKKYSVIAFSKHNLALNTFLEVQINRSANIICTWVFELVKIVPTTSRHRELTVNTFW